MTFSICIFFSFFFFQIFIRKALNKQQPSMDDSSGILQKVSLLPVPLQKWGQTASLDRGKLSFPFVSHLTLPKGFLKSLAKESPWERWGKKIMNFYLSVPEPFSLAPHLPLSQQIISYCNWFYWYLFVMTIFSTTFYQPLPYYFSPFHNKLF